MEKLKESGFEINAENLTKIVKDAAAFNIDKASQDIIDAKNEQIKKLQEENRELKKVKGNFSARNVMAQSGSKITTMDKKK